MKSSGFKQLMFIAILLIFFNISSTVRADKHPIEEIILKNIQNAGGEINIKSISNITLNFKPQNPGAKSWQMITDRSGRVRYQIGEQPLIENLYLINGSTVQSKIFYQAPELREIDRVDLTVLSRFFLGAGSLYYFRDRLNYSGIKQYGPLRRYILKTLIQNYTVTFQVDVQDKNIKQIMVETNSKMGNNYKIIYDFMGKFPNPTHSLPELLQKSNLGVGQVNFSYGGIFKLIKVKINSRLKHTLFEETELNYGEVSISDSKVEGNITDIRPREEVKRVFINTNLIKKNLDDSGLISEKELMITIDKKKYPALFFNPISMMTTESRKPGKVVVALIDDSSYVIILMFGDKLVKESLQLKLLEKIKITKKESEEKK